MSKAPMISAILFFYCDYSGDRSASAATLFGRVGGQG